MVELIKVSFDPEQKPFVMGRDLYEALQIRTNYMNWFPRMCEYGFEEGKDFIPNLVESTGGRPGMDHQLTIEMAKEICMIQRTEIGKRCREYFLELERRWNSPEAVMARALQFANRQLALVQEQNALLLETNAVQAQQIQEMKPKASYYDVVLGCKDLLSISKISKDVYQGSDGMPHTKVHMYWTQKGRLFIYQLMKADGHLPVMEQET